MLIAILFLAQSVAAQSESRPSIGRKAVAYLKGTPWVYDSLLYTTHNKVLLGIGHGALLDTYLSPIVHAGRDLQIKALTDHASRRGYHRYSELEGELGLLRNPANYALIYHFGVDYSTGPLWRVYDRGGLRVNVGGLYNISGRGNLKLSNTNNVFTLKASTGIDAMVRGTYRLSLCGYPIVMGYSAQASLLHLTFSPEYGQSYYDYVSEENKQGIKLYMTHPGNRFSFHQRAVVDLPIRHFTFTFGIEHRYNSEDLNRLEYRKSHLSLLLGWSFDSVRLGGGKSMRSSFVRNMYHQ